MSIPFHGLPGDFNLLFMVNGDASLRSLSVSSRISVFYGLPGDESSLPAPFSSATVDSCYVLPSDGLHLVVFNLVYLIILVFVFRQLFFLLHKDSILCSAR